jgi:alginate O-acetyltransferase complex protein AlgI
MTFTSVEFLFFFVPAFVVYWLLPRRAAWQNAWLLLLGGVFYASWHPHMLALLVVAILFDYTIGVFISRNPADGTPGRTSLRRRLLGLSIGGNLALLGYFKYLGFMAASLAALLERMGMPGALPSLEIALPMGISYFTLQKLSYVIDVYDSRLPACTSLPRFATAIAFFPHMVAGPVTRPAALLPQLEVPRHLQPTDISTGALLFLVGFLEKACIADNFASTLVDPVFSRPGELSASAHWLAALGYTMQVFCDFAGYSLMALGVARGLGLSLPVNFDKPFLSINLNEFWRRWHISLNTWIFEYIYTPLTTGTGFFRGRLDLGFLLVFLVSGLWHGASWGFVAWGAMHGLGLVVVRRWDEFYRGLCRKDRKWVARRRTTAYKGVAWALTMGFFVLSLIPFRAGTGADLVAFLGGLVPGGARENLPLGLFTLTTTVGVGLTVVTVEHLLGLPRFAPLSGRFLALPAPVRGLVYGLVVVYVLVFVPQTQGLFIYARF